MPIPWTRRMKPYQRTVDDQVQAYTGHWIWKCAYSTLPGSELVFPQICFISSKWYHEMSSLKRKSSVTQWESRACDYNCTTQQQQGVSGSLRRRGKALPEMLADVKRHKEGKEAPWWNTNSFSSSRTWQELGWANKRQPGVKTDGGDFPDKNWNLRNLPLTEALGGCYF